MWFPFFASSCLLKHNTENLLAWKDVRNLTSDTGFIGLAGMMGGFTGNILIAGGGCNFPDVMPWEGGKKKYYADLFVYEHKQDGLLVAKQKIQLPQPVAYAASCSTKDGIIYAGGENTEGITDNVYRIQWQKEQQKFFFKSLPSLPKKLTNTSLVCVNNTLFLAGGEMTSAVSDKIWKLDLAHTASGWILLTKLPVAVSHMVMLVQKNSRKHTTLVLLGGRRKDSSSISQLYNSVYAYDLAENSWETLPALPYNLSAGTGIAYGEDMIVLFGGDKGTIFTQIEQLNTSIEKETDLSIKEKLVQQKKQLLLQHPGFSNDVLLYQTYSGKSTVIGKSKLRLPVTTLLTEKKRQLFIIGGEIKPGIRTAKIISLQL